MTFGEALDRSIKLNRTEKILAQERNRIAEIGTNLKSLESASGVPATRIYTVVGFYEDNMQPWCDHIEAANAQEAMSKAPCTAIGAFHGEMPPMETPEDDEEDEDDE